jgi:hypothetical protein
VKNMARSLRPFPQAFASMLNLHSGCSGSKIDGIVNVLSRKYIIMYILCSVSNMKIRN